MDKKTRSENQTEACPRSSGNRSNDSSENKANDKSGAASRKIPAHSGLKFSGNPKKTTVVKPFSFDRKGAEEVRKEEKKKKKEEVANLKTTAHSGLKFNANPKKTTVVKPFSFDRKKKEGESPSCSAEKKVEKEVTPEPKDAEGKVHVVMDTMKISTSEELNSEEACSTRRAECPVGNSECANNDHDRCSRAMKMITSLLVEKPARAKSPSKEGKTPNTKKDSEKAMKKESTRCRRHMPDPAETPKSEVKPSKGGSHLKGSSIETPVKKECTRWNTGKSEPPKDRKSEVKTRAKSPDNAPKSDESKSQPTKTIKTKPACSKIAKLQQQATKSESKTSKTSQGNLAVEVQVAAVDSTVTEITQNTYVSKESVVMSSQTSNTESFCVVKESLSSSGNEDRLESNLKSSMLRAAEEKQTLLNGSEPGMFYVTEDGCNLLNGTNIVSEILEEAKYEAESFMQTKDIQEMQKLTSKIPRKTQGAPPIVKINGNLVKESVVEHFSFENRCPNSMDQLADLEESLLVN